MSYNIDTWRTKKLEGLKIPISEIHKLPYVAINLLPENKIEVAGVSEGFEIEGMLENDIIAVSQIVMTGEGSGRTWENVISCLKNSTGELIATQVWEGGDSITRLTVKDGIVIEENIEI